MADSTKGNTDGQYLGLLTSALFALMAGLVVHAFIIRVNVNDWWKGRSVTPVDHIVTSLGISRLCAQFAITLYTILVSMRKWNSLFTLVIIGRVYVFFTYTNFWLTSFLSIIFCLKISNLNTRLFLYLRSILVQRTDYFIVASVLFSAVYCLTPLSMTITEIIQGGIYNGTVENRSADCRNITFKYNFIYNFTVGAIIPLLFYCISSVLLFTSLYQHIVRMKMSSNLTINLETYYSVMRFVSVTFIYNTIYFIGQFVSTFWYFFYCVNLPWLYLFLDCLPLLHSSVLIYRTAKLRNPISKVLWNIVDVLFQRKEADIRENIEVEAQCA